MWPTGLVIMFFFQAEDGIRDDLVTGVQTCALPISAPPTRPPTRGRPQSLWCAWAEPAPRPAARAAVATTQSPLPSMFLMSSSKSAITGACARLCPTRALDNRFCGSCQLAPALCCARSQAHANSQQGERGMLKRTVAFLAVPTFAVALASAAFAQTAN